jgi:hypothetical protein
MSGEFKDWELPRLVRFVESMRAHWDATWGRDGEIEFEDGHSGFQVEAHEAQAEIRRRLAQEIPR